MRHALLRKEARELLPWAILSAAVGLVPLVDHFIAQTDMRPLGQTFFLLNDFGGTIYWLVAFAIGTGLVTREHDDGTLAFLDGLPLSRSRSFFAKAAVMAAIVIIPPFANVVALAVLHVLSRGSLDQALHVTLLAKAFALQALLVVNGLFLGAALGRLRNLTWLMFGIAAVGMQILVEYVPRVSALNPLSLLDWQWTSSDLIVDSAALQTQAAVTAAAFIVAWRGFVRAGQSRLATLAARPVLGAVITVATVAVGSAAVLLTMSGGAPEEETAGDLSAAASFQFAESPPAQTVTEHFRFSYPAHEAEAALALAAEADAVFEHVHELLGVPLGASIDVDASGSMTNTHGTAFYGRLRMTLDSEVLPVLAHETAHVVAGRAAGEQSAWLWNQATVINEGLASWVETRYREYLGRTDERMFVLAALYARRELVIEELANPAVLLQRRDETVMYAAGEALIDAVVRVYGDDAIARLLEAFADPRLPTDLSGLPLWQGTFQLAGMDVAAVIDELFRAVAAYADEHAERIAALPRPRVRLVRIGNVIGVLPLVDSPPGGAAPELVLRFKPAPDSPLHLLETRDAAPGMVLWRMPDQIAGGRVCVQPGVGVGREVLYEPWTCIPTSDAEPFARD